MISAEPESRVKNMVCVILNPSLEENWLITAETDVPTPSGVYG
jgi:hypothetical protein